MTEREFLNSILKIADLPEGVSEHATERLAKLDERNAKRQSKPSKTALANEPIKVGIVEVLTESGKVMTAAEIGVACEISTNKASALAKQLTDEGKLIQTEVKVKGKGKVKGYSLATSAEEVDE